MKILSKLLELLGWAFKIFFKIIFNKKMIAVLLFGIILGAGFYFGWPSIKQFVERPRNVADISQVQLKPEIIKFIYKSAHPLYTGIVRINDEIMLIDQEINRLNNIEAEFPNQTGLIAQERAVWAAGKESLVSTLAQLEAEIEAMYVGYLINEETGTSGIPSKIESLKPIIDNALNNSDLLTSRLKKKPENLMDQIKFF